MANEKRWSVWEISDADEPGDHVLAGMRHRDYDEVMLLLVPDGEPGDPDWYGTPRTTDGRPTRPLLLFVKGELPTEEEALRWVLERDDEAGSDWFPFPETFCDPLEPESAESILVHSTYPPFPWLEEARLGMRMGRYYSDVELVDWVEPTEDAPGIYTFRFFRNDGTSSGQSVEEIPDDMLPF